MILSPIVVFAAFFIALSLTIRRPASAGTRDIGDGFALHGVAAPVSRARGVAATVDGGGRPIVLAWPMDHRGCGSILVIDARTGQVEQIPTPFGMASTPFAVLLSTRNRFYSYFDKFVEFDTETRRFTFWSDAPRDFAMSFTEDDNGTVWTSAYPNCELLSYVPDSGDLINHGPLNDETWPQYPRTIAVDSSGWVYVGIGSTRGQVVAFNPETGKRTTLVPESDRRHGASTVYRGVDGKVYGRPFSEGPWWAMLEGEVTVVDNPAAEQPVSAGSQEAVLDNFPDGWSLDEINLPEKYVEIREAEKVRRLAIDYESAGSHILSIAEGPDGRIHGSTGHPLRFYTYDAQADTIIDRGLWDLSGHLNALAVQGEKIYCGEYSGGRLWEYDPLRPWDDRASKDPNPRVLVSVSPTIIRPHALLAHPDGRRLIMTGTPGYGLTGGGMLIWDTETERHTLLTHEDLLPSHSTVSLVALPDGNIVGGTTISPGTGGEALATEAELYILDPDEGRVLFREAVVPGAPEIRDMLRGPDGLIYGLAAGSAFFVFNPESREVVHFEEKLPYGDPAGQQAPRILATGPGNMIYALFRDAIVRIEPGSFEHKLLGNPPVRASAGIVIQGGRLYFTHGSEVWSFRLPGM